MPPGRCRLRSIARSCASGSVPTSTHAERASPPLCRGCYLSSAEVSSWLVLVRLEDEDLASQIRVDVGVAHEGDHRAARKLLNSGDDVALHGGLKAPSAAQHVLLPSAARLRSAFVSVSCISTTTMSPWNEARAFVGPRPRYSRWIRTAALQIAAPKWFLRALCRTRTGDPFLTIPCPFAATRRRVAPVPRGRREANGARVAVPKRRPLDDGGRRAAWVVERPSVSIGPAGLASAFDALRRKWRRSRRFAEWAVAGSNRGPPACKAGALTS
jgi:hypothetical protein